MREILFKGKRTDNQQWVEGFYALIGDENPNAYIIKSNGRRVRVAHKSVSQYTGICDKNCKKIFEGDIVKTQPFYDRPYSSKRKEKQFVGVVEYDTYKFNGNRFYDEQVYDAHWRVKLSEDIDKYTHYAWSDFWNCEVIGNIYDNPELLEVGVKK